MEIKFEHIEYLYMLFSIPVILIIIITYIRWQKKKSAIFSDELLIKELTKSKSIRRRNIKYAITILVLCFVILGLSNPKIGSELKEVKREGIEIVIAMDLSTSMLCEDIKPNRLKIAKESVSHLIGQLDGDKIGLVAFAGDAFIQLPITSDYAAAQMFLSNMNTRTIKRQGTDYTAAIKESMKCFDFENKFNKSIIIITDGENNEYGAIESAQKAAEKGVYIHTLSIGSKKGDSIPTIDPKGLKTGRYKKNHLRETVITKPDYTFLSKFAKNGNGTSINIQDYDYTSEVPELLKEIDNIEKQEVSSMIFTKHTSRFQWFLGVAFILIMLNFMIMEKTNNKLNKIKIKK